jgi:hypothetical protein
MANAELMLYCDEYSVEGGQSYYDSVAIRELQLRVENLKRLETLRTLINEEEDKMLSVDDVLARVLNFYGKFVPF